VSDGVESPTSDPWFRRPGWVVAGIVAIVLLVAQLVLRGTTYFPKSWDLDLAKPVNQFHSWVGRNRKSNFVISQILRPIGDFVVWLYDRLLDVLLPLPWFWLGLMVFLVIVRSGRYVYAVLAGSALLYLEFAGLHVQGTQTIALMLICVFLCVVIGAPLGIWAGLHPRADKVMRPVLDGLQSLPTSLYMVTALMFFGIRQTPAAVATVLFGIPPMIRIVSVGIRQVPQASVEAGRVFGSSQWQMLWKVQAPQAVKSFVIAVNQTILICLSMAVIGGLIGAGGLGGEIIQTLKLRSPGRGMLIGLGIFAIAFAFDRVSRSLIETGRQSSISSRTYWLGVVGALVVTYFGGRAIDSGKVPWTFGTGISRPVDDAVDWMQQHWGSSLRVFSDFVVRHGVVDFRELLGESIAWPVLIGGVAAVAWRLRGPLFALFCAAGLMLIGLLGMWQPALTTLVQIVLAVGVGMLIALPLGVFIGRRPRIEAVVEPLLDALQTVPSIVYAIPFVKLFGIEFVPAILATMFYAVPAGLRLAALAVKDVPAETLEASTTFGATNRQRLWKIHLPLAMRGMVLAVNQLIMLSISMAIVAGQVGENGLGFESVQGLVKPDLGVGAEAGVALLVMAIILDRMTEGVANQFDNASTAVAAH